MRPDLYMYAVPIHILHYMYIQVQVGSALCVRTATCCNAEAPTRLRVQAVLQIEHEN